MKFPYLLRAFLLFLLANAFCHAQNPGTIKGSVVDPDGKTMPSVLVTLLQADGTTIEKTSLTEDDGSFQFDNLPFKTYFISIAANELGGYQSNAISLDTQNSVQQLAPIVLKKDEAIQLTEVKIATKVPFVTQKVDRTIVNPEALISNTGGTALDVLSKSPGVLVDENGNIRFRGRSGVLILIDDKPTYLTGTELENYLKSLPSNAIKQVELMTNPPAKYEASGNAGVINIITKRSKLKGLNGNVSLNYGQGNIPGLSIIST